VDFFYIENQENTMTQHDTYSCNNIF